MKKLVSVAIVIISFVLYACGPSVEGQSGAWTSNLAELNKLKTEYPHFSSMIDEKIDEATKIFDAAGSLAEEDAKAEKMQEANAILNSGCVGDLKNMKSKIEEVNTKIEDLKTFRRGKSSADVQLAEIVISDANDVLKTAKESLADTNAATACDKISDSYKKLTATITDIASTKKGIQDKIDEENIAKKDGAAKTDGTTDAAKAVKCDYCGVTSVPKDGKCPSCGGVSDSK